MKVLVLGTAGVSKLEYMSAVWTIACDQNICPGGARSSRADKFLVVRDLDKELEQKKGGYAQYGVYLSETDQDEQEKDWSSACENVIQDVGQLNPQHAFLLIHGVYFRNKTFRSMLDMNLLRKFSPTLILVLIEDAYDVVARIERKEKAAGTRSRCMMSEAIEWRTVETMVGNLLSRNLNPVKRIPIFVVARKHPPEMVYQLLFERWRLIVYLAFPISQVRHNRKAVSQINEFRSAFADDFTVFDPVTIDEYPITRTRPPRIKRWPGLASDVDGLRGMTVSAFKALEEDIRKTIELRDFLLVDQSNCLVAYRPFYGRRESPSSGVDSEMSQCLNRGKPLFVVHDEKVDGPLTSARLMFKPMASATAIKPRIDEILKEVKLTQNARQQKWEKEGLPNTWE